VGRPRGCWLSLVVPDGCCSDMKGWSMCSVYRQPDWSILTTNSRSEYSMVCSAAQPCVSCHARLRVPLTIFCPLGTTLRHRSRSVLAKAPLPAGLLLRVASDSKGKLLPRDDGLWGDSAAQPCESGRAASSLASSEPFTAARPQSSFSGSCEMMYAKALSAASSHQS